MIALNKQDNYYRLVLSKNETLTREEAQLLNKINAYRKYKGKSIIKILQERNDYTNNLNLTCEVVNTLKVKETSLDIEVNNESFVKIIESKGINFVFRQEIRKYTHDELLLRITGFEKSRLMHDIEVFNEFVEKLDCDELDSYLLACIYENKLVYTQVKVRTKRLDDIRDDLMNIHLKEI